MHCDHCDKLGSFTRSNANALRPLWHVCEYYKCIVAFVISTSCAVRNNVYNLGISTGIVISPQPCNKLIVQVYHINECLALAHFTTCIYHCFWLLWKLSTKQHFNYKTTWLSYTHCVSEFGLPRSSKCNSKTLLEMSDTSGFLAWTMW